MQDPNEDCPIKASNATGRGTGVACRNVRADDLDQGEAGRACLQALRAAAGQSAGPMERHCLRTFLIADRLAGGRRIDREVLACASWLHDAGLWSRSDDPYVTEAARLAERTLEPFGWPAERVQLCMDACEQHHAPTSREDMGLEVELIRRADLIEVSGGVVAFGVPRAWLRELFRAVPRNGFYPMITRAVAAELRARPGTLRQVFVRPLRTRAAAR